MKTKMVHYQNMFDPAETIVAANRIMHWVDLHNLHVKEYVHINTVEEAQKRTCRCHHPNFIGGVCRYRNCNHDENHHN